MGKNRTRKIGIEVNAPIKLEKQMLFIFFFLIIKKIFCITPVRIMLPNNIFICSQILSFTGANMDVIKEGNLSYRKWRGKQRAKAIIILIIFSFFLCIICTYIYYV